MDEVYEVSFQLILAAGNSKSESMIAIRNAREGKFDEALEHVKNAQESLTEAHQIQTDLIQGEARGEKCEVTLIMVHAQDHLNMALLTMDQAKEMIHLYKEIYELKK
ncbi:PTS system cellobiose-specific IIA component [Breznakia blatticola]|uniref:PTS system cellobiose-specific IIA component n=1 Tax=Breznakia blatticola TaxID=1754012 RepID=A0A4R7Z9U1_9FIRM|nr:PTS lactose/cellobiose transporter subunit IIA [Breznakia blatticola]TDW09480.1 PTS system cellobiose-specific IIA component [Breznakia blatticola]